MRHLHMMDNFNLNNLLEVNYRKHYETKYVLMQGV